MSLLLEAGPMPLETTADGAVWVGATRVPLDTVVTVFNQGATPEEIVQRYPTLVLADIYAVIGFYLQQREAVDGYLQQRRDEATRVRAQNESRTDRQGIRERLLARRTEQAVRLAAPGR